MTLLITEGALLVVLGAAYGILNALDPQAFQFENPWMLWFLIASPLLSVAFVFAVRWRIKVLNAFATNNLITHLIPDFSSKKNAVKFILFKLGVVFVLVGLSQPQFGLDAVETEVEGADIIVAIDVSNSMLAQDLDPSRLARSKMAIEQVVNQLLGDRIGIVTFAGIADIHIPITSDYRAVKSFLGGVTTDFPVQGTAIGEAIELSMRSFSENSKAAKVIIVISDGENHEDDAIAAAKKAADEGIVVHAIGVGSPLGVPIPVGGNVNSDFKKDENQNPILTKLNEEMMKDIAKAGKGTYVRASNADVGLNIIMSDIDKMESEGTTLVQYSDYREYFQIFLLLGVLLLIADALIGEQKNKWTENVDLFK